MSGRDPLTFIVGCTLYIAIMVTLIWIKMIFKKK